MKIVKALEINQLNVENRTIYLLVTITQLGSMDNKIIIIVSSFAGLLAHNSLVFWGHSANHHILKSCILHSTIHVQIHILLQPRFR